MEVSSNTKPHDKPVLPSLSEVISPLLDDQHESPVTLPSFLSPDIPHNFITVPFYPNSLSNNASHTSPTMERKLFSPFVVVESKDTTSSMKHLGRITFASQHSKDPGWISPHLIIIQAKRKNQEIEGGTCWYVNVTDLS